jgi:hypothetical protein
MRLTAVLFVLTIAALPAAAQDAAEPKAVIELFTSQGCSSCPVADSLLAKLAQDPGVIALTLPVDYWDYLGWKDTLASPAHSARQRAYAMAHGDTKVMTPQIVVSGMLRANGKDEGAVKSAIQQAHSRPEVMSLDVSIKPDGDRFDVHADPKPGSDVSGEVWVLATAKEKRVKVEGGENVGKDLPYVNVVRKMTRLGPWNGKFCKYAISREDALGPDADEVVVLVQEGSGGMPGPILGAAQLAVR